MQTLQKKNSQIQNKFETAVQHLQKYHQGNSLFDIRFPKYAVGQKFITPFQQLRIQNSSFCDCTFLSSLIRTNMSGSKYEKCVFDTIDFENSNLQFSNLNECTIRSCNISGSNFSNCFMDHITFNQNTFIGSNFLKTQLNNCKIQGGEMISSTLEFAEFRNTYFENLRLANLSMEYSEFNNVQMENVVLPFAQLPFIFGGLDYILLTNDNISISANMKDIKSISVDEYIQTFEDWKIFFYNRELYFPLANILLAQNKKEEALEALLSGILTMINHSDYRMLKYLCKLAASHNSVSKAECRMLYTRIEELISSMPQTPVQQYNYAIHMNDIRNILVENPKSESRLYLSLKTNILTDEQPCLYHIVSYLEMFLDIPSFALTTKTISIRHNSPYEIIAVVVGATYVLSKIVESITNIFHNVRVTGDDIIGIRNAQKNGAQNDDLDNQLKAAALRKENMEIKKLELEIEQLQADIAKNNVHTNITHNIKENEKIYLA